MAHDEDTDSFDILFAEISKADGAATKVIEVSDEPAVVAPLAESREAVIETLVSQPVAEVAKPDKYKTVEKTEVEGGPCQSKVYPLGYVSLVWNQGWRFQNKALFYMNDIKDFVAFCRDQAKCDAWLASLEAAGCRNRGEVRKEG